MTDTDFMGVVRGYLFKKVAASTVDGIIEFSGGLLGSYFGAMVAALVTVMKENVHPETMQGSIKSGFGLGFVFWALGISFINRVLIQGISRASIGKKLFSLELISTGDPLTWSKVTYRWVLSVGSALMFGAGYFYSLFNAENKTLHDVIAETDVSPEFDSAGIEMEYVETIRPAAEIRQMMIISSIQEERPVATVIRLPLQAIEKQTTANESGAEEHTAATKKVA